MVTSVFHFFAHTEKKTQGGSTRGGGVARYLQVILFLKVSNFLRELEWSIRTEFPLLVEIGSILFGSLHDFPSSAGGSTPCCYS